MNPLKIVKQVLGSAAMLVLCTSVTDAYSLPQAYQSGGAGTGYQNGSYQYGQGYSGGSSYQTSYYGQGYSGFQQGYQGYYNNGYQGMGTAFSYVDNNWIEDNLRFAVTDVNQSRPYQSIQRLNVVLGYVQQFGDSELFRRLQLATRLGYKSSLAAEINTIYSDWKAGKLRLAWESGANQSFQGQDDISKDYVVAQLNAVMADLNSNQQNRGRQRLQGLTPAIPPMGNDRLIRRIQYAAMISTPSKMREEVTAIIGELNAGTLVLNDTVNNAQNFYYGGGQVSPYPQPTFPQPQTYPPVAQQPGGNQTGGLEPLPGYNTVNYPTTTYVNTGSSTVTNPNGNTNTTGGTNAGTATPQPQPVPAAPTAPQVDVAQLKANVASAYDALKVALSSGEREKIQAAQKTYADAQAAYEKAKQ